MSTMSSEIEVSQLTLRADCAIAPISNAEVSKWLDHFQNLAESEGDLSFLEPSIPSQQRTDLEAYECQSSVSSSSSSSSSCCIFSKSFSSSSGAASLTDSEFSEKTSLAAVDYKFIAEGSQGILHKFMDPVSGDMMACKSVFRENGSNLATEILSMQALAGHPMVAQLHDVYEDEDVVHLTLPFYEGGDLFSRLTKKISFSENEAAKICASIASVLKYSHSRGIVHRDLKLENIFLKSNESNTDVVIGDFGLAAFIVPGQKLKSVVGTPKYMSPEVLHRRYGPKTDLWSLGVVLYALLSGEFPFSGSSEVEAGKEVDMSSQPWQNISNSAKNLVQFLLLRNDRMRYNPDDVLCHPWIVSHCESAWLQELHEITN